MIDPNKTYQTKSGREWRYYGENGNGQIHGAYKTSDGIWNMAVWEKDGTYVDIINSPISLVEVKPRIKRTYWFNIYENSSHDFFAVGTREFLDKWDHPNRLACVKVEIDCEVGEGL
jgi:hypothetical protein